MRHASLPAFVVAAFLATGCGGAKVVVPEKLAAQKRPVRLLAVAANDQLFSAALGDELLALGYGILEEKRTTAMLADLDIAKSEVSAARSLAQFQRRRVDSVLLLNTSFVRLTNPGVVELRPREVHARVLDAASGEALASLRWTNSWGGEPNSPLDWVRRKTTPVSAKIVAGLLARQLGAPGPKETPDLDDLVAVRAAKAARAAALAAQAAAPAAQAAVPAPVAAPSFHSDVDAPAAKAPERPEDFALVIGIEEYQSLPKADHGARDAKTVRKHLEALGFPARNIVSLEGAQATKSKLESYLREWLPLNVKETSTLFVYYSGHGAPDPKTGDAYLVPWDADPKFLRSSAYPLKSLYADLGKTKAKRVLVALDACFSGAGGRSVLAQGARPLVAKVDDGVPAASRLTVLAAASGDEITGTLEEQGHGLFTYHLLKGLAADPKSSARALHRYLLPKVQDDARRQNREQTPTLAGASLDAPLLP